MNNKQLAVVIALGLGIIALLSILLYITITQESRQIGIIEETLSNFEFEIIE